VPYKFPVEGLVIKCVNIFLRCDQNISLKKLNAQNYLLIKNLLLAKNILNHCGNYYE